MTNEAQDRILKVTKKVKGSSEEYEKAYTFSIKVIYADGEKYNKPIEGTKSILGSGLYTFELKHGESIELRLPLYCDYELAEDQIVDYLNQEPVGLRIRKKVEGNGGDKNGKFEFTLKLKRFGEAIECIAYYEEGAKITELEEGLYHIELTHQGSAIFKVPYGTKYTVVEKDYAYMSYETEVNGEETLEMKGVAKDVEKDTLVSYVNTREVTPEIYLAPKTGDGANIALYAGLGLAAVIGLAVVLLFKKKKAE